MAWTPESSDPLSTTLTATTLEAASMNLWNEWLSAWFNGGTHFEVAYPRATVACQMTSPVLPLDTSSGGLAIRLVGNMEGRSRRYRVDDAWRGKNFFKLTVYVLSSVKLSAPVGGLNSEGLCRKGSDLLYALLQDHESLLPLARAGLQSIRVAPPKIGNIPEFACRTMQVTGSMVFSL